MPLKPDRYAVIGNPIAHSRSPEIHALFAAQTGACMEYVRLLAPPDGFVTTVAEFRAAGGCGANVTVPFKTEAWAYATRHTARARLAGAVNTLAFEGAQVLGDNTDGVGLVDDIQARMGLPLAGLRLLIVGAGGAARGVVGPLLEAGVAQLTVANRTPEKAREWVALMHEQLPQTSAKRLSVSGLDDLTAGFDVIVNATSAGLSGSAPAVPVAAWSGVRLALDMVYGAQPTPFMQAARQAGCAQVADGFGMLVGQAAAAFELWRGVRPALGPAYRALRP